MLAVFSKTEKWWTGSDFEDISSLLSIEQDMKLLAPYHVATRWCCMFSSTVTYSKRIIIHSLKRHESLCITICIKNSITQKRFNWSEAKLLLHFFFYLFPIIRPASRANSAGDLQNKPKNYYDENLWIYSQATEWFQCDMFVEHGTEACWCSRWGSGAAACETAT